MKKLEINELEAKQLFKTASDELKSKLVDAFGEDNFQEKGYEKINSYEAACEFFGEDPVKYRPYPDPKTPEEELSNADKELTIIYKAICKLDGDWKADFSNPGQKKYFPYLKMLTSGFVFSRSLYDCWHSGTSVGARLCFSKNEIAIFFGNTFIENIRRVHKI